MDTIYSFGYWVRRRRKALDLTQRQLAEQVGCALITLKKIEADERRPSVQMADRLADALQIPTAERLEFGRVARGERPVDTIKTPPSPTLYRSRDSLPTPSTTLVGREAELQTVLALLDQPEARLVTVVGPGGMGKTRLALATGQSLGEREPRPFPQGIYFIDLSAATSTSELVNIVANSLGFEPDQRSRDPATLIQQLAVYLRPRKCLLILDNVEQIPGTAEVVDGWLRSTTASRFLVTSRERLNLSSEHLLALGGLTYLSATDPDNYPAGRLFLNRARRVRSGFVAPETEWPSVALVCRMLDGMPLALELAASWVDTLSPGEIAIELQRDLGLLSSDLVDLPARHRSFDTIWASTWARLDPGAQSAFAQLSVFRGGFTRAGAKAVAGASLADLAQLTGHYLIELDRESGRYRMHELLRQYAAEELGASGAAAEARQRHFDYYAGLLNEEQDHMRGSGQLLTLERLDREQDNIRLALNWGMAAPTHADTVARMVFALHMYWRIRSRVREGQEWVTRALAQSGHSSEGEARLHYVAGLLAWMVGDSDAAWQHQQTCLSLLQDEDLSTTPFGAQLAAQVQASLGMTAFMQGRTDEALAFELRSLDLFRAQEDEWNIAFVFARIGRVYQRAGDVTAAEEAMREGIERSHRLGDPFLQAIATSNAAFMALIAGDSTRAAELALQATIYQRQTGHFHSLGQLLVMLGRFAREQGDEATAVSYFEEALAISTDIGKVAFAAEAEALLAEGHGINHG